MSRASVRPTILLTGANGQIGWELARTLAPLGTVVALTRADLDLTDGRRICSVVRRHAPQVIVNAAAFTKVDAAEREPERAWAVNGEAPRVLADEAARLNAPLIHYSTDYVFDGDAGEPYREEAEPHPLNVYGASKLAGERAVAAAGAAHVIFRTGWVYGLRGSNFLRTIMRSAQEREPLRVVDDQVGAPTWSRMIAEATAHVLVALRSEAGAFALSEAHYGIYHLTAGGETTWFRFAQAILEVDGSAAARTASVTAIRSDDLSAPARRPRYSVLDNTRIERVFGIRLPHWKAQLRMVTADPADAA